MHQTKSGPIHKKIALYLEVKLKSPQGTFKMTLLTSLGKKDCQHNSTGLLKQRIFIFSSKSRISVLLLECS